MHTNQQQQIILTFQELGIDSAAEAESTEARQFLTELAREQFPDGQYSINPTCDYIVVFGNR